MTIGQTKHKTLFISDLHLGSHNCKAKRLYEFLWRHDADRIYLIGDIVEMRSKNKWPPFHDNVLRILAQKAQDGTELVFIPGNHDSVFRYHVGDYGNLRIANHASHDCVNGETLLVIHGDETDLFRIDIILWLIVKFEHLTGLSLWNLLRKYFSRLIGSHVQAFENKMMALAHDRGFLGVVCGHIHMPNIVDRGAFYLNPGDFTHHCTAIAEDHKGHFKILYG
jgi:UDP-2,3-diacylglucosamine pyrophosphatase LpxH